MTSVHIHLGSKARSRDAARDHKRLYPSYTLKELEAWVAEGKVTGEKLEAVKSEIEARKSSASKPSVTPQVAWGGMRPINPSGGRDQERSIVKLGSGWTAERERDGTWSAYSTSGHYARGGFKSAEEVRTYLRGEGAI